MKKIIFIWSKQVHEGIIRSQEPSSILGLKTVIDVYAIGNTPLAMTFTMFGKCEVGDCNPYYVVSIQDKDTSDVLNDTFCQRIHAHSY